MCVHRIINKIGSCPVTQKIHERRELWISVTPKSRKAYEDECENILFKGYLLQEIITPIRQQQVSSAES